MKQIFCLLGVGIIFIIVVPVQAMLKLPPEIQNVIRHNLDVKDLLSMREVCSTIKNTYDAFPSEIFEEHGISLREAFKKKNAHILGRYIKDGNYKELINDVSLTRAIMLWAVHNDHRAIFDGLRQDPEIIDNMSNRIAREILIWALLYEFRDYCINLAKTSSKIDPQSEFVNNGLEQSVKHCVPSIVHTFTHTPCYAHLVKAESFKNALLMAIQNSCCNVVRILLSNQRVLRLLTQNDVREAIVLACQNNAEDIVECFLNNRHVVTCLSVSWLRKMSNRFCDDWICNLLERCRENKLFGV